jgi:type VI secretion system protein ImpH
MNSAPHHPSADAAPTEGAASSGPVRPAPRTLLEALHDDPGSFTFDAAVAVLSASGGPGDRAGKIRFRTAFGLGFVAADVISVEADGDGGFRLATPVLGLTGPSGALPRRYTEHVIDERRAHSCALSDFLDLLAQRPIWQFAQAGMKYRPDRLAEAAALRGDPSEDLSRFAMQAMAGFAIPGVARRLGPLLDTVLHHAAAFAGHPRSAERLGAILSDWLGEQVEIEQFAGRWRHLPTAEMTRLPAAGGSGQFHRLGVDAAIGDAVWDIQSAIQLRIGPMTLSRFVDLLPGRPLFTELATLAHAYVDGAVEIAINPVLAAEAIPPLALAQDEADSGRLGWDTWLGLGRRRERDGDEATFQLERPASVER